MKDQKSKHEAISRKQIIAEIDPQILTTLIRIVKEEMMAYQHSLLPNLDRRVVLKTATAIEFVEVQNVTAYF